MNVDLTPLKNLKRELTFLNINLGVKFCQSMTSFNQQLNLPTGALHGAEIVLIQLRLGCRTFLHIHVSIKHEY